MHDYEENDAVNASEFMKAVDDGIIRENDRFWVCGLSYSSLQKKPGKFVTPAEAMYTGGGSHNPQIYTVKPRKKVSLFSNTPYADDSDLFVFATKEECEEQYRVLSERVYKQVAEAREQLDGILARVDKYWGSN